MNPLLISIFVFIFSLFSSFGWGEKMDDLVERGGVLYKKFSDIPFSGQITGLTKGLVQDGKREGVWVWLFDNGNLLQKGEYKNGLEQGPWIGYYRNGQLWYKEERKNGLMDGVQTMYTENGNIILEGKYKSSLREGIWKKYFENGQLKEKLNYINGKLDGHQEFWQLSGIKNDSKTGFYKDGKKISN